MYIEAVSSTAIALCISRDELDARGLGESLSANTARELVREALRGSDEAPWEDIEIELFNCGRAVLLIARPSYGRERVFSFSDLEGVLAAAGYCPPESPSSLYEMNSEYYLVFSNVRNNLPSALYEFGESEPSAEKLLIRLREHGQQLISGNAAQKLTEVFNNLYF